MANWTNTNSSEEKVKILSHERMEETDPDIYIKRGKYFEEREQYAQAETEYLKAAKFSNNEISYVSKLVTFYYATRTKENEKKADRLYNNYLRKSAMEEWEKESILVRLCAYAIIILGSFSTLINGNTGDGNDIFILFMVSIAYRIYLSLFHPQKRFRFNARMGDPFSFSNIAKIFLIMFAVMVVPGVVMGIVSEFGIWAILSSRISQVIIFLIGFFGCVLEYSEFYSKIKAWAYKKPNSKFRDYVKKALGIFRIVAIFYLVYFEIVLFF